MQKREIMRRREGERLRDSFKRNVEWNNCFLAWREDIPVCEAGGGVAAEAVLPATTQAMIQ